MKKPTIFNGCANQRAVPDWERDARSEQPGVECTEGEMRDTLRAVLRLMANVGWKQVRH